MAKEYLERLQSLLAPVAADLPAGVALMCKPFFGGAAAYAQGRICITLTPVGLAMKLPEACREALMEKGAKPLRYFPKAPVKKQYVIVPQEVHGDRAQLAFWARKSIDHVLP